MTIQISPHLQYQGIEYTAINVKSRLFDDYFNPAQYGFSPSPLSSACWAGYTCFFKVETDILFLDTVTINEAKDFKPFLFNQPPETRKRFSDMEGKLIYRNLKKPIIFTGSIFIANDYISSHYIPRGYEASNLPYKTIIQLVFQHGILIKAIDHSETMQELRDYYDSHNNSLPEGKTYILDYLRSLNPKYDLYPAKHEIENGFWGSLLCTPGPHAYTKVLRNK